MVTTVRRTHLSLTSEHFDLLVELEESQNQRSQCDSSSGCHECLTTLHLTAVEVFQCGPTEQHAAGMAKTEEVMVVQAAVTLLLIP